LGTLIHLVDQALESHLRVQMPLPTSVDVAFDAPDRTWSGRISRPTINMFLWDVSRNAERHHMGIAEGPGANGEVTRRLPNPAIDLHYIVTSWAAEQRDEHQLLGSVLATILAHRVLATETLPPPLHEGPGPAVLRLSTSEDRRVSELWSALDGQLKPGLRLCVTVPVDIDALLDVGPPTSGVDIRTTDQDSGATSARALVSGSVRAPAAAGAAGATVRSPRGSATVSDDGRFVVPGEPGDDITVDTDPPLTGIAPSSGSLELG
jgi:hypothetical protein